MSVWEYILIGWLVLIFLIEFVVFRAVCPPPFNELTFIWKVLLFPLYGISLVCRLISKLLLNVKRH
jgi:hypothetical protein